MEHTKHVQGQNKTKFKSCVLELDWKKNMKEREVVGQYY
jgi:hypothetical protein